MPGPVFINNIVYLDARKFQGVMISSSAMGAVRCQLGTWGKPNLLVSCLALVAVLQTLQESVQIPIKMKLKEKIYFPSGSFFSKINFSRPQLWPWPALTMAAFSEGDAAICN